jgi:hypothetical protein
LTRLAAATVAAVAINAAPLCAASAITISSDTSGLQTSLGRNFPGLRITTPTGGPWDNLSLNFYADTSPEADGNVFLLTQEYLGTPGGLSSRTPGFLAESTQDSFGVYEFDPAVTILGATTYWFYVDASFLL